MHDYQWGDMSRYLVHFTRGGEGNDDYLSMMGILGSGTLKADKGFGIGRSRAPSSCPQETVCLSEIPPGYWSRLEQRRETKYGIGFTKEFILSRGGAPIWYAWRDTDHYRALHEMMSNAKDDPSDPIWRVTPMIDAPGTYRNRPYIFDWEREWRHVGALRFTPADVAFLLIPEDLHEAAYGFFQTAEADHTGPAYYCPYIDPAWGRDRILAALSPDGVE